MVHVHMHNIGVLPDRFVACAARRICVVQSCIIVIIERFVCGHRYEVATKVLLRRNSGAIQTRVRCYQGAIKAHASTAHQMANAFAIVVTLLLFAFFFQQQKNTFHSQDTTSFAPAEWYSGRSRRYKKKYLRFAAMQAACMCCAWVSVRIYVCH